MKSYLEGFVPKQQNPSIITQLIALIEENLGVYGKYFPSLEYEELFVACIGMYSELRIHTRSIPLSFLSATPETHCRKEIYIDSTNTFTHSHRSSLSSTEVCLLDWPPVGDWTLGLVDPVSDNPSCGYSTCSRTLLVVASAA